MWWSGVLGGIKALFLAPFFRRFWEIYPRFWDLAYFGPKSAG